jgi:hypothetical protein
LWLTNRYHRSFDWFVTSPDVRFYSMLVANLCMGWIDQLVLTSFAWRTHDILLV